MVTVHLPNGGRMWAADVDGKRPESPVTTPCSCSQPGNLVLSLPLSLTLMPVFSAEPHTRFLWCVIAAKAERTPGSAHGAVVFKESIRFQAHQANPAWVRLVGGDSRQRTV